MGIIGGLVLLWFVSRWSPKGTVLGISIALFVFGTCIDVIPNREVRLLRGIVGLVALGGCILGLIDVARKDKPKDPKTESDVTTEASAETAADHA
jgi:hypothetical protein